MLGTLREQVYRANMDLVRRGLVTLTWGNVSGVDREREYVVIKPSGVPYEQMTPEHMVVVNFKGRTVQGTLRPSSDTPTHVALYRAWPEIGGVVHTHSPAATAFAQAGRPLPCLGTTHADTFHGAVRLAPALTPEAVDADYEGETGKSIIAAMQGVRPLEIPAILCAHHAPFAWGATPEEAVTNAFILESVARMALDTLRLNPDVGELPAYIADKHYTRKHGPRAYYGQARK